MKDFIGYYNVCENTDAKYSIKEINFKLCGEDYDLLCKIDSIFEHIEEKSRIDLENHFYADNRGAEYLKTILSNEAIFKDDIIPNENTKYDCRVILRIQSVYHRTKHELKNLFATDNEFIDLLLELDEIIRDLNTILKHCR